MLVLPIYQIQTFFFSLELLPILPLKYFIIPTKLKLIELLFQLQNITVINCD
jgi:hypothetical protein